MRVRGQSGDRARADMPEITFVVCRKERLEAFARQRRVQFREGSMPPWIVIDGVTDVH